MQHVTAKAEHLPGGNARERESTLQVSTNSLFHIEKQTICTWYNHLACRENEF